MAQEVSAWEWGIFGLLVVVMIAIDLFSHRHTHEESKKASFIWSGVWIVVGLAFAVFVGIRHGSAPAQEYLGAYLLEKSLSLDNLFVFLVIFSSLQVHPDNQRRVLFWGIFGALLFRALFIALGIEALEHWHWVVYVFGGILLVSAWRIALRHPHETGDDKVVRWLGRHLPVTHQFHGSHFFARESGRWKATPLLIALLAIELTDIAFAIDSVPAALAVSREPFIVYTSNVFAILGLRALYVALAQSVSELRYLHWGLAAVLAFAGLKMILAKWVKLPPLVSVGIIIMCIGVAVWASLRAKARETQRQEPPTGGGREAHA